MSVQLRLKLSEDAVPALLRSEVLVNLAATEPRSIRVSNTYFDNPELRLKHHGLELRTQAQDHQLTATLRQGRISAAGLQEAREWKVPVIRSEPELQSLEKVLEAEPLLQNVIGEPALTGQLGPIFDCQYLRTVWPLELPDGGRVELTLEQGQLSHGDRHEPLCELGLGLKAGKTGNLFDVALQLLERVPLHIDILSSTERGYALFRPQKSAATKAQPINLPRAATIEETFQLIVQGCLQQVQDNAVGVLRADEPECVHQMRVGLRRLKTALKVFRPTLAAPGRLRRELSWLANVLGKARDADVLALTLLPPMLGPDCTDPGLAALHDAACLHAANEHREASLAVRSVRYSRLLLGLVAWVHELGWRKRLDFDAKYQLTLPIEQSLPGLMQESHARLLKRGKQGIKIDAQARHKFRIAVKNTRYTASFFSSALDRDDLSQYIDCLAALQKCLGDLNDVRIGQQQLQALIRERPALAGSAKRASAIMAQSAKRDLRHLTKLWRKVRTVDPPIRLPKRQPKRRARATVPGQAQPPTSTRSIH